MRWLNIVHSFFGINLHQVALDLDRVGVHGQAEPAAEAADVRIDRDAGHVEAVAEDRRSPSCGRRRAACTSSSIVRGHLAADTPRRGGGTSPGCSSPCCGRSRWTGSSSPVRADRRRRRLGVGIAGEQGRRDQVDAHVGALGGEDGGDEQLQRRAKIEAQWASGYIFAKPAKDGPDALLVRFGYASNGLWSSHGLTSVAATVGSAFEHAPPGRGEKTKLAL